MTHRSGHRGFTLIEVLLATFVIALGVLGLLALFAGAARQQQDSSQTTSAAFAANDAQGALLQDFGALEFPPGVQNQFDLGVWYPLPMHSTRHYLSVNPGGTADGPYILDPPTEDVPRNLYVLEDPGGTYDFPFAGGVPVWEFDDQPVAPYDNSNDNYFFRDRRIVPNSIRFVVRYRLARDSDGDGTPDSTWSEFAPTFGRLPGVIYDSDAASQTSGQWVVPMNGDRNHDPVDTLSTIPAGERNYIVVDVQPTFDGTDPARLFAVHFGFIGNPPLGHFSGHVMGIRLLNYRWRNDQLVSLDDRLKTRPDPSGFRGRVAEQCYSILFRRRPGNLTDVTLMAYQLTPTSSGDRFIPPERLADIAPTTNLGPIKSVSMVLYRDIADPTKQFYFRLDDDVGSPLWAIQPGQQLLIASGPGGVGGADDAVEVVRLYRETLEEGSDWRGYINRMPRVFIPPPGPPDRAAILPEDMSAGPYVVFGVADSVRSLVPPDRSTWKLTPLFSRTFEVKFRN